MKIRFYTTRPRKVEAFAYSGFMGEPGWPEGWLTAPHVFERGGKRVVIKHRDGDRSAVVGDFVVKDPIEHEGNQFSTVKAGIFQGTYFECEEDY